MRRTLPLSSTMVIALLLAGGVALVTLGLMAASPAFAKPKVVKPTDKLDTAIVCPTEPVVEYTEVIVPVSTTPDKVDYQVRWSDHLNTSPWSDVYESGTPFSITNGAYGVDTTITLEVRAVRGSQVDATPATCSWTLLTIESAGAPDTIITGSFPEDGGTIGTDSQAFFFFDSDDPSVFAFECRLIAQFNDRPNIVPDFNTCSGNGEQRYSNLPAGQYTFEVRAVNPEGIPDPIPARVSFTVQ